MLNIIRFADDTVLLAEDQKGLHKLVDVFVILYVKDRS